MTDQPYAPQIASKATLAMSAVRAHITIDLRAVADPGTSVTLPDDGGPITVTAYGRTIQITALDVTDQQMWTQPTEPPARPNELYTDGPHVVRRCTMHGLWCGCPSDTAQPNI